MQRQKQEIDIMKYTIHHISDLASCLRSPKSWEQFSQELAGDTMYIHKRENYKDMLC